MNDPIAQSTWTISFAIEAIPKSGAISDETSRQHDRDRSMAFQDEFRRSFSSGGKGSWIDLVLDEATVKKVLEWIAPRINRKECGFAPEIWKKSRP